MSNQDSKRSKSKLYIWRRPPKGSWRVLFTDKLPKDSKDLIVKGSYKNMFECLAAIYKNPIRQ